jgi:hypothetical protein
MEVRGYPNYLIYPDGRVYNKKYKRFLKPSDNGQGYLKVDLCKDGERKTHSIHRLVAEQYIPNPDNKPEVDHIYRDRKDNRVENLQWVTSSENSQNICVRKDNKLKHKNIFIHQYTVNDKEYIYYKYKKTYNQKSFIKRLV